jgi:O-methyltransferase
LSTSRELYLDLIERSVAGLIYPEGRFERRLADLLQRLRLPYATRRLVLPYPIRAHTMIGSHRLRQLRSFMETTLAEGVPGDFIETGVWRGGACIMMRAVLKAHGVSDRKVYCADSFRGLPKPSGRHVQDKRDRLHKFAELAVPETEVRKNFEAYGLLDDQVVFVNGFFRDTLPPLKGHSFALLRLDGDMYESTMDALTNLYDGLSPGGFIIVDDYGSLNSCRLAVHDFLDARSLKIEINRFDGAVGWWRKPR